MEKMEGMVIMLVDQGNFINSFRVNFKAINVIDGGDDCFETFFSSKDEGDLDEILTAIENTKENFIQLDIGIEPFSPDDVIDVFVVLSISLYNFLNEADLLTLIPTSA